MHEKLEDFRVFLVDRKTDGQTKKLKKEKSLLHGLRGAIDEYHLRQFYLRSLQSLRNENIILKYLKIFRNRFVDEHFCLRPLNSGQNGP